MHAFLVAFDVLFEENFQEYLYSFPNTPYLPFAFYLYVSFVDGSRGPGGTDAGRAEY